VSLRLNRTSLSTLRTATHQWVPGDVHIHMNYGGHYRNTPENLVRQAEAEGLRVVHNLIVNKEQRIPDVEYFRGDKIDPASTARTLLLHSQEYHTSAWGHLGLLGLRENLLIPDYADYPQTAAASLYPSNNVVSDLARAQGALVGYVHPFDAPAPDPYKNARVSYALPADVAHGKVDYLEVMGFSDHLITSDVWYRLLNLGYRIPAAAGTDAMMNYASLRGPLGLVRVYVKVPTRPLASAPARQEMMRDRLDGLRAGRTFVTNGPLLAFRLGGKEIGDEVKLPAGGGKLTFNASVRSIVPLDHAQVICTGEVVRELPLATDRMSVEVKGDLVVGRSGWCILRAYAEKATHPILDLYPFASTSPIYVSVDGEPPQSPADAAFFVKWMDRVFEFARTRSNWNTTEERTEVLTYLEKARAIFLEKHKTTQESLEQGDYLEAVPSDRREQLRQAITQLIGAEQGGDWARVASLVELDSPFELRDPRLKKAPRTEEEEVKELQGSMRLRRFVPDSISSPDESDEIGIWKVMGCAEFEGDKKGIGHRSSILAYWDQDRWVLTPTAQTRYDSPNTLRECKLD